MKSPVTVTKTSRTLAFLLALCLFAGVFSIGASAASAPPVPANFQAASASYNSVKLTWSAAAGASGYVLYRAGSASGSYARLAAVQALNYTNTGLVTGVRYYYKVRAYKTVSGRNVYGSPSAAVSAVPLPSVPANFKAASASYNSVKLTWSAVAGASGYAVYRLNAATKAYERLAAAAATSYTQTGLSTGTAYSYKVRAYRTVSGKNVYGNPSAAVSAVPVPGVPADFKAAAGTYQNIKLSWSAVAGASGYVLYRLNAGSGAYERLAAVKTTAYTDEWLAGAGPQSYKAAAYRTVAGKNVYGPISRAAGAVPGIYGPVGGSAADIVDFYNRAANATKAYTGKVTVDRSSHIASQLIFSPPTLRNLIQLFAPDEFAEIEEMENYLAALSAMPPEETRVVFENGADGSTTLNDFLPPSGKTTMSTLTAAGAKSATCAAVSGGWKIVITLVQESGNTANYIPPHHSACLNTPDFSDFGDMEGAQTAITYRGATLTAYVNTNGRLSKLMTKDPYSFMFTTTATEIPFYTGQAGMGITSVLDDNFVFTYQ